MTYNILVPYFTRSEHAPLEPLLKVAEKHPFDKLFKLWKVDGRVYDAPDYYPEDGYGHSLIPKVDMVLCGFDRPEMAKYAYDWYHAHPKTPICQIFAGDIAGGAFDDKDRFAISNYADLIFTAGERQFDRVRWALKWRWDVVGSEASIFCSGATHYDDMKCQSLHDLPKRYALVLYNPPSLLSIDEMMIELEEMGRWLMDRQYGTILWARPNGDMGSEEILDFAKRLRYTKILPQLDRGMFLSYISKASVFVGNSSSLFYEAPYFRTPIKQFGMRNRWREAPDDYVPGASTYILTKMYDYLEGKK